MGNGQTNTFHGGALVVGDEDVRDHRVGYGTILYLVRFPNLL